MVLHALTSLTYVVIVVARRLRYIGEYVKPMESFVGSFTPPKGREMQCSGFKFNPHRWTVHEDPRVDAL